MKTVIGSDEPTEIEVVEGSHVYCSKGDMFMEWDHLKETDRDTIVRLRDQIKSVSESLADVLQALSVKEAA